MKTVELFQDETVFNFLENGLTEVTASHTLLVFGLHLCKTKLM